MQSKGFALSHKAIMHYRKLDESEIKETSAITSKNFRERLIASALGVIIGDMCFLVCVVAHWLMASNPQVLHTNPLAVTILLFLAIATCGYGVLVLAAMLSWYLVRIIAGKESR